MSNNDEKKNNKQFYAAIAQRLKDGWPPNEIDSVRYRYTTHNRSEYITERVTSSEIDIVNRTLAKRCPHGYIKCYYPSCR